MTPTIQICNTEFSSYWLSHIATSAKEAGKCSLWVHDSPSKIEILLLKKQGRKKYWETTVFFSQYFLRINWIKKKWLCSDFCYMLWESPLGKVSKITWHLIIRCIVSFKVKLEFRSSEDAVTSSSINLSSISALMTTAASYQWAPIW